MERVQSNGQWSLFCPSEAPGLADCWGKEFEELYTRYERDVISFVLSLYFLKDKFFTGFWMLIILMHISRARPRRLSRHKTSGLRF
jgi:hypothetical protein